MDSVGVNGGNGAILHLRGAAISRVFRAGFGDYHVIFQPGFGRPLAEFHPSVIATEDGARIIQLGPGAAPGGANLVAGETSQQVLAFDDLGPADSDFLLSLERR